MREEKNLDREPGPQPDPMLRTGRASPVMIWTIGALCVVILVGLLIAISPPLTNSASVVNGRTHFGVAHPAPNTVPPNNNGTTGTGRVR